VPERSTARRLAFVAILVFMVFGPFYRQVLGGESRLFRQWTMFGGTGVGIVDATFLRRLSDGREVVLDRYEVLGFSERRDAPREIRRIVGRRETWEVARRLCEALGPNADVRVVSREATRDGWRPGYSGEENLCAEPPPEDAPGNVPDDETAPSSGGRR